MYDIVVRGGTIIDGTGRAAFTGDVAIADGRIAAVGGKAGPARRDIDAAGLLVTPGWVDVHTHYDGQAMWDPLLAPSCWHGVTTTVFGNCGVGFAPVKPQHRAALMDLMEGVEEIPGVVLADGLTWEWESFPISSMRWSASRVRSMWPRRSHICRCASMSWATAPFG
ncbi:MAG TPA: amidohydrolase family protein [Xanthobacteraceae bacterium]|nr:amidohydrolase family protein [Xanthobacteraceae bacterium]